MMSEHERTIHHEAAGSPSSAVIDELDAYEEIVRKLERDLTREREAKEAAQRDIVGLRRSYYLLLERQNGSSSSCSVEEVQDV